VGKPILVLDFDGVCHSYVSGWCGATTCPDPPVPGLFEFLEEAAGVFEIHVLSSRTREPGGREAMASWFQAETRAWEERVGRHGEWRLTFPSAKPAAFLTLDDRALCFTGVWPSVPGLLAFRPWYKLGAGGGGTLADAVAAFLAKYDECRPELDGMFATQFARTGHQYDGPTFGAELEAMRAAWARPPVNPGG
jgi:hypothetical protein